MKIICESVIYSQVLKFSSFCSEHTTKPLKLKTSLQTSEHRFFKKRICSKVIASFKISNSCFQYAVASSRASFADLSFSIPHTTSQLLGASKNILPIILSKKIFWNYLFSRLIFRRILSTHFVNLSSPQYLLRLALCFANNVSACLTKQKFRMLYFVKASKFVPIFVRYLKKQG